MSGLTAVDMSLFGDRMFTSTDLNRKYGEVLSAALESPVTISRNADTFALMTREQAGRLFRPAAGFAAAADVLAAVVAVKRQPESAPEPLQWLTVFGTEEMSGFEREFTSASQLAAEDPGGWDLVAEVVGEWRALAAKMEREKWEPGREEEARVGGEEV